MTDGDNTIWKRRVALEQQLREARSIVLGPVYAKFDPLFEELKAECEFIGHEWRTEAWTIAGDAIDRCINCNRRRTQ